MWPCVLKNALKHDPIIEVVVSKCLVNYLPFMFYALYAIKMALR